MNGSQLTWSDRMIRSEFKNHEQHHCECSNTFFFHFKKNTLSILHFSLLESHPFLKPFDHTHRYHFLFNILFLYSLFDQIEIQSSASTTFVQSCYYLTYEVNMVQQIHISLLLLNNLLPLSLLPNNGTVNLLLNFFFSLFSLSIQVWCNKRRG